jgi:UDP-N-acetylmuramoylalanine--D-glutamate ligase
MDIENFKEKSVLVLGMGVSGLEILDELISLGCKPDVVDDSNLEIIKDYENIEFFDTISYLKKNKKVDIIFKSPGIKYSHPIIKEYPNAKITNDIELAYLMCKGEETKIIGITGTNGKTSTTAFISHLLNASGYKARSCGNIGISPLRVLKEDKIDFLVMELSSFQLKSIYNFKCDYAFLLNISPDHLDYHGTEQDYIDSKLNIIKNIPTNEKLYCGLDIKLNDIEVVTANSKEILKKISVCGVSRTNMQLVYAFARDVQIPEQKFIEATKSFKPMPHRVEFIMKKNGISYYNDSKATNVEATKMALTSLENIILLVGGYDKGEDLTLIEKYLKNVKQVIAYGANKEKFEFIHGIKLCVSLEEALKKAIACSLEGDCILLSPASASYDQFKNYEERGNLFKKLVLGGQ